MSSSDDDTYFVPSKPLKRRKFKKLDENAFENVSLFSNKVMPSISKTNQAVFKKINEGLFYFNQFFFVVYYYCKLLVILLLIVVIFVI